MSSSYPDFGVVVVGPGGSGKSQVDFAFKPPSLLARVDPYRLRGAGPRSSLDVFYGHPFLKNQLTSVLTALDDPGVQVDSSSTWHPRARVFFFPGPLADEDQVVFLPPAGVAFKAEIYVPALVSLLGLRTSFSSDRLRVLFLNPSVSITQPASLPAIQAATFEQCSYLNDRDPAKKKAAVLVEFPKWQELILQSKAIEYDHWEHAEHTYRLPSLSDPELLRFQRRKLKKARDCILFKCPELVPLMRTDEEIDQIDRFIA